MTEHKVFTFRIGGQAGQGVKSAGLVLAKFATRSGYYALTDVEYPSIIRGGHNVMQINISREEVTGPTRKIDFLIALNQETIDLHVDELSPNASILFDFDDNLDVSEVDKSVHFYRVPLSKLAKDAGGEDILSNTIAVAAVVAACGGELQILRDLLSEEFAGKDQSVTDVNHKAADLGFRYVKDNYPDKLTECLVELEDDTKPKMVINGNDAAALGAIAGGVQFAAIYPMSPISDILHVLAAHQEKYGYIYKQPEDEIAAINMAVGASFAGARSMVATSGGGFALMTEGYGLAGITELPVVIIEGMRGGPATGIPTWSGQGDLRFVLHAHQDDFPRIILTPGDVEETFEMTMQAFNLADKYQTPVVVLIDKNICSNDKSVQYFDVSEYQVDRGKFTMDKVEDYKRYGPAEDGISLRSAAGVGNFFVANSDEHDEIGYSSEEIEERNTQMMKRMRKLETCALQDMPEQKVYGVDPAQADLTIVSWGSNKGSILQALQSYNNVSFLNLTWANPFPIAQVKEVLGSSKRVLNIEANFTAQMGGLIREKTGIEIKENFLKYDGRPFYVEEIKEKIESLISNIKL